MLLPIGAPLAAPFLVKRFGTAGTLAFAGVVCAAGLAALASTPLILVAALAYTISMSTVGIHGSTRNLFSQQIVAAPWRTTTAAILTVGMGLGWASAAAIGGLLLPMFDFRGLFFLASGTASLGAVVAWAYLRAHRSVAVAAAAPVSS